MKMAATPNTTTKITSISAQANSISSEVRGLIDFKYYVRHHGEVLYQCYGNYADAALLSAERQGPWASCYVRSLVVVIK